MERKPRLAVQNNGYNLRIRLFLICFFAVPLLCGGLSFLIVEIGNILLDNATDSRRVSFLFVPLVIMSATYAGIIPYVALGLPAMWSVSRRTAPTPGMLAKTAMTANLLTPIGALAFMAMSEREVFSGRVFLTIGETLFFFLFYGTVFAAIWGAMVGWLYSRLDRIIPRERARRDVQ